jgi:hypothetical protein
VKPATDVTLVQKEESDEQDASVMPQTTTIAIENLKGLLVREDIHHSCTRNSGIAPLAGPHAPFLETACGHRCVMWRPVSALRATLESPSLTA